MDAPPLPCLDEEALLGLVRQVGRATVLDLFDGYRGDAVTAIAALTAEAEPGGSPLRLRNIAHDLKSTSALFGLARLAGVARRIEVLGAQAVGVDGGAVAGWQAELAPLLDDLRRAFDEALAAVAAFL
jgi:HPt (histidine-containing phosphotransfer) domain-containing protein